MIEAGVEAPAGSPEPDGDNASNIVAAVYVAVEGARRPPHPNWPRRAA
jgi:hypothetical protein